MIMKLISLFVYYLILKWLPSASYFRLGVNLRAYFCKFIFFDCGDDVNIASGVRFGRGNGLVIGNRSGLGEGSYIVCMDEVRIGDDVMIGPEVMILTGGHDYMNSDLLLREQVILTAPVKIGDDCWIGARTIILPGVSICTRVIVGAGSVVSKSIKEPGVYVGNPVRKIKSL